MYHGICQIACCVSVQLAIVVNKSYRAPFTTSLVTTSTGLSSQTSCRNYATQRKMTWYWQYCISEMYLSYLNKRNSKIGQGLHANNGGYNQSIIRISFRSVSHLVYAKERIEPLTWHPTNTSPVSLLPRNAWINGSPAVTIIYCICSNKQNRRAMDWSMSCYFTAAVTVREYRRCSQQQNVMPGS